MQSKQQYCHPPLFKRWRCLTHDVGSYNFNWLVKHVIDDVCEVITDITVGVVKPKTYGGLNGNIGRDNFPEWHQKIRLAQSHKSIKEKWEKFLIKQRREIQRHREGSTRKLAYRIKKVF